MGWRSLRLRVRAAAAMAVLAIAVVAALPLHAAVFNPETFTLKNGMQVVVVPNHRMPVVVHMVWYKVGAADEVDGKSGLAHFLEHLMFKGTPKYPDGAFSQIVARNGGRENAFTTADYTAYHQTVAKDRLELVMRMEADRMTHLRLTPENIESERQVVLEELRMRTKNDPGSLLQEYVDAALFLNYPYRRPIIGWAPEVRALTLDDVLAFYHHWYAPNNAILVVAGDITAAELKPLAEKYYGAIPRGPDVARKRPPEPQQLAPRRVTLSDERVKQPNWRRVYMAPSYVYGDTKRTYALQVLAEILGGGPTGRLNRALAVDGKVAVSAGAYYGARAVGPARFGVYASPLPGVGMDALESAVDGVLEAARHGGISDADVETAKKRIIDDAVYARDSLGTGARLLGASLAVGLGVDDVETWPERIGAVTPDEVRAALDVVLDIRHSVTAELLPKAPGGGKV